MGFRTMRLFTLEKFSINSWKNIGVKNKYDIMFLKRKIYIKSEGEYNGKGKWNSNRIEN